VDQRSVASYWSDEIWAGRGRTRPGFGWAAAAAALGSVGPAGEG